MQTRVQSECLLWYELRYGRITASKLHEASKCQTTSGSLVKQIIGAAKMYETKAMERGKVLEKQVFTELTKSGFVIKKCGLLLNSTIPIFGASPDAIGIDYVVEIKCPISWKCFKTYIFENQITNKYKAQILLQMFAAGKKKGLFCVADPDFEKNKKIHKLWIEFEEKLLDKLLCDATNFWKNNIYPILIKTFQ